MDERLRVFLAVCESGSLTGAADLLELSQPAVSRQMRLLEAALGQPLLRRHGRGIALTEAGEVLRRTIAPAYATIDAALDELGASTGRIAGAVRIAGVHTLNAYFTPRLIERLADQYPGLILHVLGRPSGEVTDLTERGHADLGLVYDVVVGSDKLAVEPLFVETMMLIHHQDAALRRAADGAVLVDGTLPMVLFPRVYALRRMIDKAYSDDLRVLAEVETLDLMLETVRQTRSACILPSELPSSMIEATGLERSPLHGPPLTRRVVAVRRYGRPTRPIQAILQTVDALAPTAAKPPEARPTLAET